jgi:hypothetical protein
VQAPLLYPYIPQQLKGLLGAIKGAAEYERLVIDAYGDDLAALNADGTPIVNADGTPKIDGLYTEGQRRMGPQLVAHLLMIALIVVGNIVYVLDRKRGGRR